MSEMATSPLPPPTSGPEKKIHRAGDTLDFIRSLTREVPISAVIIAFALGWMAGRRR